MATTFSVPDTSGSSGTTETGIAGGNTAPYSSAMLGLTVTDALTTGDLQQGDAGEFGGLTQFAVEFVFKTGGAAVAANSTLIRGPRSSSGGLDQWTISLLTTGQLKLDVIDEGGTSRNITTTASLPPIGNWYHIVATAEAGWINLYVNGALAINSNAWAGHMVQSMGSTAGLLDVRLIGPANLGTTFYWDELALYTTPLSAARVLEHWNAAFYRGYFVQFPGTRIGTILDNVGNTAPRSLQTGSSRVIPRYMSGQSPLEEIRRAVEAEDVDAGFFVAKDGTLVFLADGHRSAAPYSTSQATFGDAPSGEALTYVDISFDYSPTFLINEWNVTRSAFGAQLPATQTVSDATSIARYKKRSQSLSDVPTISDVSTSAIATRLLAKYKDPMLRITSVTFSTMDPAIAAQVLQRELMDKITIKRQPRGGGSVISQDVFIQKIAVQGANDGKPWVVTWTVSPL